MRQVDNNGKSDKLCPDRTVNIVSQFFVPLRTESGQDINGTIVEKFPFFPTVIYTPLYDKRSKSYEFLNISQAAVSPC
jgi:hypothetical protein